MSTFKQYQPLAYCPDGTYLPFDGPKDTLEEAWESIDSSLGKNDLPLSRTKYVVLTMWPDARVAPHYETYQQEDLGERKEPSLDNTSDVDIQACRHMREAEWALKRIGIGIIPSWPDLAVRCYQCNITINAEGPIGQVNRLQIPAT